MFSLVQPARALAAACVVVFALAACNHGGHSSVPNTGASPEASTPAVVPSTQPVVVSSPSPPATVDAAAYVCPASDTAAPASTGRSVATGDGVRRAPLRRTAAASAPSAGSQLIAVTYDARVAAAQKTTLALRESTLGATRVSQFSFAHTNLVTHVLAVPAAQVSRVESALRLSAGVRSVGLTGTRRYATSVSGPYFPNDPYFTGFSTTVAPTSGATAPPSTFKAVPLVESADVPGQWDMHVSRLEYAFAYGLSNNGSGITNLGALGSAAIKLAVIDTGEDTTHPELQSKIVYQRCFITNPDGVQSTSNFTTDPDGHGTDVAGIAGAASNNGLGFTAAGGNVQLFGYRVFPTPNDSCAGSTSTDSQCSTNTVDIAAAIQDAVNNGVSVISMSLGGQVCTNGLDPDTLEGNAIADAISANIVVVAAAGNSGVPPVEAPACDPNVIAVGATGLDDGTPNGTGHTGGTAQAPLEYVASYTDFGTPGAAVGSSSAWGIVAPGGDPTGSNDSDNLHWIENLWTSRPFQATSNDNNFTGNCVGDYPTQSGTADCRVLIAGTSMATPHVAGAAALIISANPTYKSPTLMKTLLCSTADDIGDPNEGCGRLDVYRAMATAVGDTSPPAPRPIP